VSFASGGSPEFTPAFALVVDKFGFIMPIDFASVDDFGDGKNGN
jgi:hypothetical protein